MKAPHTNTTASAGAELLLHVALGTFSQQRERSAQSPEESREHSISGEESVGRDQRGKSCPTAQTVKTMLSRFLILFDQANKRQPRLRGCLPPQKPFTTTHSAHVKIMPTLEGEAVQFRGMPVFQTKVCVSFIAIISDADFVPGHPYSSHAVG